MAAISTRVSDDEFQLIQSYTKANGYSLSAFIRDTVLDRIENDLNLDEERILNALRRSKKEKAYDHTEVWEMIGV